MSNPVAHAAQESGVPARAAHIADRLRRAVHGPMWHGDAVNELLVGISPRDAASQPLEAAHSIWTLVLHMTAWADIARDRVHGTSLGDPAEARNFPAVPVRVTARAWASARTQLTLAHDRLADAVAALTDDALTTRVTGKSHTIGEMLDGVVEHSTYHGGQIAILKRALISAARHS